MKTNNISIYIPHSAKLARCFLLADEGVLIDCGMPWEGKKILAELQENGFDISAINHILLTHNDIDHIGGVHALQKATNATVWIGKDDANPAKIKPDGLKSRIKIALIKLLTPKMPKEIRFLEEWQHTTIQAIPTPGHTKGHYAFQYKNHLFIGDIYKNVNGKLTSPGVNREPSALTQTRQWLHTINPQEIRIIPSHGDVITKWETPHSD